mgnify:CR=1 FL=1
MAKTKAEKIADIELQMTQLENQRKKLIQEQKRIAGLIEATISGIRSALDVPEGWALRTLDEGFVAPAQAEEVPPEE